MQNDPKQLRQGLRQEMIRHRRALQRQEVIQASQVIAKKLSALNPLQHAQTIMGFAAIQNEVDLQLFLEEQRRCGKRILMPRVEGEQIVAVEWQAEEAGRISPFGICEPLGPPVPAEEIDVVLAPGLVFDARGYRLGYGRGYYDRFLPLLRHNAFKCGVCYDFQIVDNVFPHAKDVALHWIVTEKSEVLIDPDFF